jgi:predicted transposase/invertase (TIGR01784 family)
LARPGRTKTCGKRPGIDNFVNTSQPPEPMERYINPFTDFGFKKIFGEEANKDLLIDFLNELLHETGPIVDLTYLKNEHLGSAQEDRKAIFDLYCENERGEKFIVELQKARQKFFKDRSLYYSTFAVQEQAKTGEWDFKLQRVYTVSIMDFVFDERQADPDKFIHTIGLLDEHTKTVFNDKLRFVYVEMPKFTKTEDELDTHFDKWLYLLRNLARLQAVPRRLQDRIFRKLFEVAELARYSPNDRRSYQDSVKYYRDIKNITDTALEEGIQRGLDLGIEKGIQLGIEQGIEQGITQGITQGIGQGVTQERINIARTLKALGEPTDRIMQITGLSQAEINGL